MQVICVLLCYPSCQESDVVGGKWGAEGRGSVAQSVHSMTRRADVEMQVSVVIDVGSKYGSENQSLQRLGRLTRPGVEIDGSPKVGYFYTIQIRDCPLSEWITEKKKAFIECETGGTFLTEEMHASSEDACEEGITSDSYRLIAKMMQERDAIPSVAPSAGQSVCPITKHAPNDPVRAADGHLYERSAIEAWLAQGNVFSPSTGALLANNTLRPPSSSKRLRKRPLHTTRQQ